MKTEVVVKREIFGHTIKQKSKSELFSGTDLVGAGNKWRMENKLKIFNLRTWLASNYTKEFIKQLEKEYDRVIIRATSRWNDTWLHPFLFIDLALAINPKFKIEVYKWLYDELLKYRNCSGDSYKKMTGALYLNQSNKSLFSTDIRLVADRIKNACDVNDWDEATEKQLKLRNKIHDNIALLCDVLKNNEDAVRIGIQKAIDGR